MSVARDSLCAEFPALFESGLGKIQRPPVKFHLREDAHPKFHKARPIPYALREEVERELECLPSRFQPGDPMWVRNFGHGRRCCSGVIRGSEAVAASTTPQVLQTSIRLRRPVQRLNL
ncbi:hypothetical protein MRX96_020438 [Rhipicephalus microplus]